MMNTPVSMSALLTGLVAMVFAGSAMAQSETRPVGGSEWGVTLEIPIFPALQDLQPAARGSFDSLGFGLGGSWYKPVRQFANSELLLGIDGWIAATDSNIAGAREDLLARHLYLGAAAKWFPGDAGRLSLDLGAGYHEIDIAQVISYSRGSSEFEHWTSRRGGLYVGTTWKLGARRATDPGGGVLGVRVHFVDFGRVYDHDNLGFSPTLGPDAGDLDGPLYMIHFGYIWR